MSFFIDWQRERAIRRTLVTLSRQRLVAILPGGVWVVEKTGPKNSEANEHLITCHWRGWVEVLQENVPLRHINGDNPLASIKSYPGFDSTHNIYRLTEGGWAVLNRSHGWVLATFIVSAISLIATVYFGIKVASADPTSSVAMPVSVVKPLPERAKK
ncbi:MAG: hypothetical protein ACXWVF_07865 [Telluria sp.]